MAVAGEQGAMLIVCPHCTTSYALDLATLGASGRTVRCARCKEIWVAHPEDAVSPAAQLPAMAEAGDAVPENLDEWGIAAEDSADATPMVESPPLTGDWPEDNAEEPADWTDSGDDEATDSHNPAKPSHRKSLKRPPMPRIGQLTGLPALTVAMGALLVALFVWRADVVRLMPQTASFYKTAGLDVNLRGVAFKDLKVSSENVDGKPVLVIEGKIVSSSRKTVDLPRLRFSVRDAQGAEIYAWNAVLDQTVLNPGDQTAFKSRLASPPPEGRNIDIRFFNRRDVTGGSA
jgi:predicted Zn finger-like uncharacterized protein